MYDYYPQMFVSFVTTSQHTEDQGLEIYRHIEKLHKMNEGR